MRFYWLILGVLTVWRIAHLLNAEDGPWDLIVALRKKAGEGFFVGLFDCFYCLSLWIALPIALWLGPTWKERVVLWPSFSAGAILLERITSREPTVPAAPYYIEGEEEHDVLWRKENSDAAERHVSHRH
jgi:hypothetical protein